MGNLNGSETIGFLLRHEANGVTRRYAILNGKKLDLWESETKPPEIIDLAMFKAVERAQSDDESLSFTIVPKHDSKAPMTFTAVAAEFETWFDVISAAVRGKPKTKKSASSKASSEEEAKRGGIDDDADLSRRVDEFETAVSNDKKDLEIKELREKLAAMKREKEREKEQLRKYNAELRKLEGMRAQIERAKQSAKREREREEEELKKSEEEKTETKGKGKEEVDDTFLKLQQKVAADNKRLKMGSKPPMTPTKIKARASAKSASSSVSKRSSREAVGVVVPDARAREQGQRERRRGVRRARSSKKQSEAEDLRATLNAADDLHACWEFNAWNGCNKGRDCLWSHRWLVNEAVHPWTGEKLPGIVERYLIDPECMDNAQSFHNNGRNNEYQGEWDRNNEKRPRWQQDRARW